MFLTIRSKTTPTQNLMVRAFTIPTPVTILIRLPVTMPVVCCVMFSALTSRVQAAAARRYGRKAVAAVLPAVPAPVQEAAAMHL